MPMTMMMMPIDVTMTNYGDGPHSELLKVIEIDQIISKNTITDGGSTATHSKL